MSQKIIFGIRAFSLCLGLCVLNSCSPAKQSDLIVKISPQESLVIELSAYSCSQVIEGIRTVDGFVDPAIKGPVVVFNKMTFEWTKDTKLYINQAKIKFVGGGIQGGSTSCDLTPDLGYYFETTTRGATQLPAGIYSNGAFSAKGKVTSNSYCRIACSMPLSDPNKPEISASGEITVKATEVSNEGEENEKYYRVKTKFKVRIRP